MLRCIRYTLSLIAVALFSLILHSCQPPKLTVVGGDEPTQDTPKTPKKLMLKAMKSPEAPKTEETSSIVLTSSSDSSPDNKHTEPATLDSGDATAQSMTNVPQRDTLAATSVDTTMTEASGREVARKRPATRQLSEKEAQPVAAKHAKKETLPLSHKEWFASFTQAVAQIEQDPEDETAWDTMDQVLNEGKKNKFLEQSITYANDNNSNAQYEYTPLHYAAAKGLLELVKELVERKNTLVDLQTNEKNTPLHMAAAGGHLDVVKYLVEEKQADIDKTDNQNASALHYAAAGRAGNNNRDVVEYLIEKNEADSKKCTEDGLSMLELAVHANNVPVVEYWVDKFTEKDDSFIKACKENALQMASAMPERHLIISILNRNK